MICLLDTHTLIWALDGDKRLSEKASETIKAVDNTMYVSVTSLWESDRRSDRYQTQP